MRHLCRQDTTALIGTRTESVTAAFFARSHPVRRSRGSSAVTSVSSLSVFARTITTVSTRRFGSGPASGKARNDAAHHFRHRTWRGRGHAILSVGQPTRHRRLHSRRRLRRSEGVHGAAGHSLL